MRDSPRAMNKFTRYLSFIVYILLALLPVSSVSASATSGTHFRTPIPSPRCHENEKSALLAFKKDFEYPAELPDYATFPMKLDLWKLDGEHTNCCAWDGVECDAESGHVVGLELCCTGFRVSINSSSSLFRLVHLRKLNLAYTNFNSSQLPSALGDLHELTSLNLSFCELTGQIPHRILDLTNLLSLDLSGNSRFQLTTSNDLGNLLQSLTKLKKLDLSGINISSSLVQVHTNSSSLSSLVLRGCGMQGNIPSLFFSFPYLQVLDMSGNSLSGHLPNFPSNTQLKSLSLENNDLSGEIPASIVNMSSLQVLDLGWNSFSGVIPPSIGNLTQLFKLDLSGNRLHGPIPSFSEGSKLKNLSLSHNQLSGSLPLSLENLVSLQDMDLSINNLTGQIPSQLLNLSLLYSLDLSNNSLSTTASESNITASQHLTYLNLSSCNLRTFPTFLLKLNMLQSLDLSSNNIVGEVPMWFQDVARENLQFLYLTSNSLTGFEGNSVILRWSNLEILDLCLNKLQGPLPIPPESIIHYRAAKNAFSGEISPLICSRSSMEWLDLGNNNLTGTIPSCFANLTKSLSVLTLHGNKLHGIIPEFSGKNCSLTMLDLYNNQLEGPLPKSLSHCFSLEHLNLGNNMIEDTFPSWLGAIPALTVLLLPSNKFYGSISEPQTDSDFPALHIIDISQNNFEGLLPAKYFQSLMSMRVSNVGEGYYIGTPDHMEKLLTVASSNSIHEYAMIITNKGIEMKYSLIQADFKIIDFSSNNFRGEIPNSIASLMGLHLLNFSNNNLRGRIPPSLGSLKNLEALDLSNNRLSGEIPVQLTELTFLGFFNVSSNNLSGHIPNGNQFDTFKNTFYEGNPGLCGVPLSRKCGSYSAERQSSGNQKRQDTDGSIIMEWKAVAVGYAIAFVVAAVIGNKIVTVKLTRYVGDMGFIKRIR